MKPLRSLLALVLVHASLALACKDPSEGKPKATVEEAKPVASSAASVAKAGQALAFDEKSATVGFVGAKVSGSHEGSFGKLSGTITLIDAKVVGSSVKVSIDTTSMAIEPEMLKKHLAGPDFFDTAKYPSSSFESTDVKPAAAGGDKYDVTGNLDLHGVKKSITFPATIAIAADAVTVSPEFVINRKDFQINYAGKADDLIKDNVTIKLSIKAPRKG